jgi:hypothetical protein
MYVTHITYMAAICKAISAKDKWMSKSQNKEIVKKWAKELEQYGYNESHLDLAINLMLKMAGEKGTRDMSEYVRDFDWNIFNNCCKCTCLLCRDTPNREDRNDPDLLSETDLVCKCAAKVLSNRDKYRDALVVKKCGLVHSKLTEKVKKLSESLEKNQKIPDWHPNTNEQVLDLIHPSLYCYVDGLTQKRFGFDDLSVKAPDLFQWLPATFDLSSGKFISDINGFPRCCSDNDELYQTVEEVFSEFLPSINECLSKYLPDYDSQKYDKLQVIVKMANTVLTPDKPSFPGGNWHLEGISSEHIACTAIHYYHNDNVVDSGLYTRVPVTEDQEHGLEYPQSEFHTMPVHYLLPNSSDGPHVQHLGPVMTNQNDCLIFPNFVQHKVSAFHLGDPTRSGVRKILLFWIVNPKHRILSTGDVQQANFGLQDAKIYRELLMYHRSHETDEQNKMYTSELSLCEH